MSAKKASCVLLLFLHCVLLCQCLLLNGPSKKKGLGVSPKNFNCADYNVLKGVHWWYDWRNSLEPYTHDCGANHVLPGYVPMVWGWHRNGRSNDHHFAQANTVLGFNEPNHRKQSNLTYQEAAHFWPNVEKMAGSRKLSNLTYQEAAHFWPNVEKMAGSRKLVSPAAAPCGNIDNCHGNVIPWFTGFFHECKGCRVDFLATHIYVCNADHTMAFLEDLWNRFHLKIWLTEFSCGDQPTSHHLAYMKQILPRLEAAPFVARYAWFSTRSVHEVHNGNLLQLNSSALSELGRFYMQF